MYPSAFPPVGRTPVRNGMAEPLPDYKDHRERLKKKYRESGIDAFLDYEAVELLLCYAIPQGAI